MSKRAEELALKVYPISTSCLSESNGDGDRNHPRRLAYIEGYEQAEKNAIERAVAWLDEHFIDGSFNSDRGYYGKMETYDFDTMAEMRESFIKAMEEE